MAPIIVWTDKSLEDLGQIEAYWLTISEFSARLKLNQIFDKVDMIVRFPRSGRVVPEYGHPEVRELFAANYRIVYYIVDETRIDIFTIHHSARPLNFKDF